MYPGVDPDRANVARVYDYLLGGTHNFTVDQDRARTLTAIVPTARDVARANRAFLGRAVRFLAAAGIRQFIDIGSGIPTEGNVHEVARAVAPESRVVYVDIDKVAIAHSKSVLDGDDKATAIEADLREPEVILGHPETRRLIDFDQPVGLLLVAVLHFISDEENPGDLVKRLTRPLRGSRRARVGSWARSLARTREPAPAAASPGRRISDSGHPDASMGGRHFCLTNFDK